MIRNAHHPVIFSQFTGLVQELPSRDKKVDSKTQQIPLWSTKIQFLQISCVCTNSLQLHIDFHANVIHVNAVNPPLGNQHLTPVINLPDLKKKEEPISVTD